MDSIELGDLTADFAHLIRRVEQSGARVEVTEGGAPRGVLLPSAELAELEHFGQRVRGGPRPWSGTIRPTPAGPQRQGPYVRYPHSDAVRMTFARDHLVVAELRSVEELAWLEEKARTGRQGSMGPKQAAAFEEFLARRRPTGDGIAWIAGSWREQEPFTVLDFLEGPTPEAVALGYGADAQDVADGLLLHQVRERSDREGGDAFLDVLAFGEADGWTWLGHHDFGGALSPVLDPPASQRITLTATMAKGLYQFDYARDGVHQNPFPLEPAEDGRHDMYELIWYTPGRTPFAPDAPLGFLNPHIRRAEEQTDYTDGMSLFFAGLERAFGLSLPREALVSGQVRCARPARARG
ncbi:type II toxin-antitoxin system prevent-host-death family antitoxin [Streptomyces sp. AA1529]|uniref:type II toxin-antitoxin system prevent-host-death family antitoxin n=1 Tax=Streptomyces sp. AA1529 TaxID=1203257 RepID=UPI003D72AFB8